MTDLERLEEALDTLHRDALLVLADAVEESGRPLLAAAYREMAFTGKWPCLVDGRWEWWLGGGSSGRLYACRLERDWIALIRARVGTPRGETCSFARCSEALRFAAESLVAFRASRSGREAAAARERGEKAQEELFR